MKTLLIFAVVQFVNLFAFARFNRMALARILVLRQQLGMYTRRKKPRPRNRDSEHGRRPSKDSRASETPGDSSIHRISLRCATPMFPVT